MRVVPQPCEEINETWIADRDRYSYLGLDAADRLTDTAHPRQQRQLAGHRLGHRAQRGSQGPAGRRGRRQRPGPGLSGASVEHARGTVPARPCGARAWVAPISITACGSATSAIRTAIGGAPGLGMALAEVDALEALFIVGANLRAELPMLAHRVRKAAGRGRARQPAAAGGLRIPVPGGSVADRAALANGLAAGRRVAGRTRVRPVRQPSGGARAAPGGRSGQRRAARRCQFTEPRVVARSGWARWPCATRPMRSCALWRASWRRSRAPRLGELLEGANGAGRLSGRLRAASPSGRAGARPQPA